MNRNLSYLSYEIPCNCPPPPTLMLQFTVGVRYLVPTILKSVLWKDSVSPRHRNDNDTFQLIRSNNNF